jgi:hypothetical protein
VQGPALATRRADRSVAVLVWNLADVAQPSGIPDAGHTRTVSGSVKRFQVELRGARPGQRVNIRFVDQERLTHAGLARDGLAPVSDPIRLSARSGARTSHRQRHSGSMQRVGSYSTSRLQA